MLELFNGVISTSKCIQTPANRNLIMYGCVDLESYAGGSIATDRVTQAGQVERDDPD
jgi:hypothetical protein